MSADANQHRVVLVVDDEPFIRINASDMLTDAGFEVLEAADADEAMEIIATHPKIGVLFTDINMPGSMDGLDLARRVHSIRPDIHLILTSGKVRPDIEQIPDSGKFIGKPYQERQFVALVKAAFG